MDSLQSTRNQGHKGSDMRRMEAFRSGNDQKERGDQNQQSLQRTTSSMILEGCGMLWYVTSLHLLTIKIKHRLRRWSTRESR